MLYPRNEDWQSFHAPWIASPKMISPIKLTDSMSPFYCPISWSSPIPNGHTRTTIGDHKTCRKIQFSDQSSPKKLFRPWTTNDDDDEKTDNSKIAEYNSIRTRVISDSNLSDQFSLKVQQLTHTLTNTSQTDDDHSKTTLELIATNLGKSAEGHRCIYCGKIYSRKYGLKIHLRTHTGFKPLKCKICNRPFGDPSNLNKHTRLHAESGAPLFQCHFCGKTLVRKRDLERHLSCRHPESDEIDVERL